MTTSDDDLLTKWDENPDEGFRLLYARYAGVLLRFVFRFTGNQEQAEEILHEIFTSAMKALGERPNEFQLKPWLFTVAKNKSLNFLKRQNREVANDEFVRDAVDGGNLENEISEKQLLNLLKNYHEHLPKDLAQTWDLRKQGLNYQEIADRLGVPIGTVKSRFSRLVDFFKKEFNVENPR